MNKVYIAFLWHNHQPDYYDPITQKYIMPWVRLHCQKAYLDMISLINEFPNLKCTFNLTPVLLKQMQDYIKQGISIPDIYLQHSLKRASELTESERIFIAKNFFKANQENMINSYTRYKELLKIRNASVTQGFINVVKKFSTQDFLDLQVWFNLAWLGFTARKEPYIQGLFDKGGQFTEDEKLYLLKYHFTVMGKTLSLYKKLYNENKIELCTSPFYHPILPLLIDTDCAKRALPDISLPKHRFNFPMDAELQIKKGVDYFTKIIGKEPSGFWPSEGSVSPEIAELLTKCNIHWFASDEDVLAHSTVDGNSNKYTNYRLDFGNSSINAIFRDRTLSDLISFHYSQVPPEQSVNDFISHLENIAHNIQAQQEPKLISIILDGENVWEYFPDSGENFLRMLYQSLSEHPYLETIGIGDFNRRFSPQRRIVVLHTGSWINHNFRIWIGDDEKNQAWELMTKVRKRFQRYLNNNTLSENTIEKVREEILNAQGSDWFWWYGEPFSSENDELFDQLFRNHLTMAYQLMRHYKSMAV